MTDKNQNDNALLSMVSDLVEEESKSSSLQDSVAPQRTEDTNNSSTNDNLGNTITDDYELNANELFKSEKVFSNGSNTYIRHKNKEAKSRDYDADNPKEFDGIKKGAKKQRSLLGKMHQFFKNKGNRKHGDDKTRKTPRMDELRRQKGVLNLEERKKLLRLLGWLLMVQMVSMNLVVFCIVGNQVFNFPFLRKMELDILSELSSLTKFYVSAVLAELLAGLIYVVHKVFDQDFDDI